MESKSLCQQTLLERELKIFLQLLSPLKTVSAPLGLVRATLNYGLCITSVLKCTLNPATAVQLAPVALKLTPSPICLKMLPSRNQATGMEHTLT